MLLKEWPHMAQRQMGQARTEARTAMTGEDKLCGALLALADDCYSGLFAYLYHLLGDRDTAREQTLEAFLRAFAARRRLPPMPHRRAWLYRIATNLVLDRLPGRRPFTWRPWPGASTPAPVQPETPLTGGSADSGTAVERALAALPPEARAIILLCDHYEFSQHEAAQVMGMREAALYTQLDAAHRLFSAVYAQHESTPQAGDTLPQLPDPWPTPGAEAVLRGLLAHPERIAEHRRQQAARRRAHRQAERSPSAQWALGLAALFIVVGLAMMIVGGLAQARRSAATRPPAARPQAASSAATAALTVTPSHTPDGSGIPPAALAWLRQNAIPLTTTQPGDDLAGLAPLKGIVGNARVIVLGEGTHGTHEFMTLKHQMMRYLVQEMGVRTLLMPIDWPNADQINEYLLIGQGDPSRYLNGADESLGNTQEVLDMLHWLRSYNQGAAPDAQVSLHSIGLMEVYTHYAADRVTAYLNQVDPAIAADVAPRILRRDPALYDKLLAHRGEYEARSSRTEFMSALYAMRALTQYDQLNDAMTADVRTALVNQLVLDNIGALLQEGGPGDRVALWTGNDGANYLQPNSYAAMLRGRTDWPIASIGFVFYQGPFNTYVWRDDSQPLPGTLMAAQAEPAPAGTVEDYLNRAGLPRLLIDLRPARVAAETEWLRQPHYMRQAVEYYNPCFEEQYYARTTLPSAFDALAFLRDTSFAALLAKPVPSPADYGPCPAAPVNLAFTAGLSGWGRVGTAPGQYRINLEPAANGQTAAHLQLTGDAQQGTGVLSQMFQALPYRGQRIRLSASVKGQGLTGEATLWLRVDAPFRTSILARQPIANTDAWQPLAIVLNVPEDAKTIGFGAGMQGRGELWFKDVRFEAVSAGTPLQGDVMEIKP
jgi:erythromycin esterase